MPYLKFSSIFTVIMVLMAYFHSAQAAPNKVYNVKAEEFIVWAKQNGYRSRSQAIDDDAICELSENRIIVKRKESKTPVLSPEARCQFTLFSPGTLTIGWKVQAMSIISNGRGNWRFIKKPAGTENIETIIAATKTGNGNFYLELKLKNIVLIGPVDSNSWHAALKK